MFFARGIGKRFFYFNFIHLCFISSYSMQDVKYMEVFHVYHFDVDRELIDWLTYCVQHHFQQYFSYIMTTSFRGGRSRSTWREALTMGEQLLKSITCCCKSSGAPFFVIYRAGRKHAILACMSCQVIQLPNSSSHPGPDRELKAVNDQIKLIQQ